LYSDGITEAEDMRDEEFGNERLEALLEQHIDCSAALIRDRIADAVDAFVDEAPQKDDETLVIVRRA
jgi:sigma-B regulation protein RsbU (phosphoserine phosphatase)